MNKEIYFEPYNEPYFESPDDVPVKISKNALRQFILDILREKGLINEECKSENSQS